MDEKEFPQSPRHTIEGEGNIENWDYKFGPGQDVPFENSFGGQGDIQVFPQGNEGNKLYHPYELEYHVGDDDETELRCYYGTMFYSINAIQTEGFTVSSTTYFGIKGQSLIAGLGSIDPASFIDQDKGSTTKYCKLRTGKLQPNGEPPPNSYGTVYLRFFVDAPNHKVTAADIKFLPKGQELEEEEPCGVLEKVNNKLLRKAPNIGRYHLKIGSFNSPQDSGIQITQSLEDHVYYAATIVDNSEAPAGSDGGDYSFTTVPPEESTSTETFDAPPVNPDPDVNVQSPQPTSLGGSSTNQPEGVSLRPGFDTIVDEVNARPSQRTLRPGFDTIVEDINAIPTVDTGSTAFGGTGAAGSAGTSDTTGYVDTGDLPDNLESSYSQQTESPQGSAGGSATSTSYSNTT